MTREPDDAADGSAEDPRSDEVGATDATDAELVALEASAEQARADARRAAQAVRMARRARAGRAAATPAPAPVPPSDDDQPAVVAEEPRTSVSLAKPGDTVVADAEDPADDDVVDDAAVAEDDDAADTDEAAGDDDAEGTDDTADDTRARRRPRRVTVAATVFAVLAAVFVVIAFVVDHNAGSDRTTSPAAARDAALLAARQDIVVLNTLDYQDVDGGLQRWLAATTGTLHDQLSQVSDADKQAIAVSKSTTTASVLAAAVTQVDASKGNATVIASVQIVVTPSSGDPTTKRNRFSLTMTEVGTSWKIGAVQQVPVTLT